jgi:hypothetical protein
VLEHEAFWYWKVGAQGTGLASNFGCSTDTAIFGFRNVESESDERRVGATGTGTGTGTGTCGDQSGRTQGTIFQSSLVYISPPLNLFPVTLSK